MLGLCFLSQTGDLKIDIAKIMIGFIIIFNVDPLWELWTFCGSCGPFVRGEEPLGELWTFCHTLHVQVSHGIVYFQCLIYLLI